MLMQIKSNFKRTENCTHFTNCWMFVSTWSMVVRPREMTAMQMIIMTNTSCLQYTEFTLKIMTPSHHRLCIVFTQYWSILVVKLDREADTTEANDRREKSTALVNVDWHLNGEMVTKKDNEWWSYFVKYHPTCRQSSVKFQIPRSCFNLNHGNQWCFWNTFLWHLIRDKSKTCTKVQNCPHRI